MNLSMDAAQIACDSRYALLAYPPSAARVRLLELSIALNADGKVRGVTVRGVPLYRTEDTPHAANEMLIGIQFLGADADAKQLLATYFGSLIFA